MGQARRLRPTAPSRRVCGGVIVDNQIGQANKVSELGLSCRPHEVSSAGRTGKGQERGKSNLITSSIHSSQELTLVPPCMSDRHDIVGQTDMLRVRALDCATHTHTTTRARQRRGLLDHACTTEARVTRPRTTEARVTRPSRRPRLHSG